MIINKRNTDLIYSSILFLVSIGALVSMYMTVKFLQDILYNYWLDNPFL